MKRVHEKNAKRKNNNNQVQGSAMTLFKVLAARIKNMRKKHTSNRTYQPKIEIPCIETYDSSIYDIEEITGKNSSNDDEHEEREHKPTEVITIELFDKDHVFGKNSSHVSTQKKANMTIIEKIKAFLK